MPATPQVQEWLSKVQYLNPADVLSVHAYPEIDPEVSEGEVRDRWGYFVYVATNAARTESGTFAFTHEEFPDVLPYLVPA